MSFYTQTSENMDSPRSQSPKQGLDVVAMADSVLLTYLEPARPKVNITFTFYPMRQWVQTKHCRLLKNLPNKRQERFRSTTSYDNSSGCDCGLCHCRSKQEASPRERRNKREIFSGVSAAQWGGWRTEWELGSQLSFKTRLPRWLLLSSWWLFHHHLSLTFENCVFYHSKSRGMKVKSMFQKTGNPFSVALSAFSHPQLRISLRLVPNSAAFSKQSVTCESGFWK